MIKKTQYTPTQIADILSVSKSMIYKWEQLKILTPNIDQNTGAKFYSLQNLAQFKQFQNMLNSKWETELLIKPLREYKCLELFAGAGGLAIGLKQAGFKNVMLNEIDKYSCKTLRFNCPEWNVVEDDVANIDFTQYHGKIDLLSGGFPCQAFSYAGKKLGFEDTRGTLFFQFARALKEVNPTIFLAENVKGLVSHDKGKTLKTIKNIIADLGYVIIDTKILKAMFYKVPQKRERLFIIGAKKNLNIHKNSFCWPSPYHRIMTLKDALKSGELYSTDVPKSAGQKYPKRKAEILSQIPPGGYWKDLSDELQKEYMGRSYFLSGGKTGIARRLSWHEPSLTLTCAPAQKQTERCHPEDDRPLTIREYARVQTFMDEWEFQGSTSSQYKQIGNAVPVNLASAIGRSLVKFLNHNS